MLEASIYKVTYAPVFRICYRVEYNYLKDIVRLPVCVKVTGAQADMQRRGARGFTQIRLRRVKSLAVPLNDDALEVIRAQIGNHQIQVFTYKGEPVSDANTKAW